MKSVHGPINFCGFYILITLMLQCSYEKNPPQSARDFSKFKAQYTGQFVDSSLNFTMEDGGSRCIYIYESPIYSDELLPNLVTANCDIKLENVELMEKRYCTFQTESNQDFFIFKFGCKYTEDGQHLPCTLSDALLPTVAELGFSSEPAKTSAAYSSASDFTSVDKATTAEITEGNNCN
jgi:hypothetical protein